MPNASEQLCDFLYSDHERVASFLAQMSQEGVLTQSEQSTSTAQGQSKKFGSDLKLIHGSAESDTHDSQQLREVYDPLWKNSLRLIKFVEKNAHSTDLDIGKIRIFRGKLLAYNLETFKGILDAQAMDEFIAGGIKDDPDHASRSSKVKREHKFKEAQVIRSYMASLPLGIGFVLVTEEAHFWFGVKKGFLSLNELDIPLKFPLHISGSWNVLGVIDAKANDAVVGVQDVLSRNIEGLLPLMPYKMMELIGATTGMFGRPLQAYRLSPLVIYRTVQF